MRLDRNPDLLSGERESAAAARGRPGCRAL